MWFWRLVVSNKQTYKNVKNCLLFYSSLVTATLILTNMFNLTDITVLLYLKLSVQFAFG